MNAMRSTLDSLRNIEIGVIEYGKSKFMLPMATKTHIENLEYDNRQVDTIKQEIFVESAIYENGTLIININSDKAASQFRIEYQDIFLYETDSKAKEQLIFNFFKICRAMDIHVICEEYEFFIPITIINKEEFISDDLKLNFKLDMRDIIDYLAGKYKSISEIERIKKIRIENNTAVSSGVSIYFRHNLQRYYKAMAALKQGLELPYYSEQAFRSYLSNPIGLKSLVQFVIEDYKKEIAGESETFVLITEIENVIAHLKFQEDRLEIDYKKNLLKYVINEAISIRKAIYKKTNKIIKNQYDILLQEYGLEVR